MVESVKTASEIYSPVSGQVLEFNKGLETSPEWVNQDPYGKGWIVKLKVADPKELDSLLSAEQYRAHIGG